MARETIVLFFLEIWPIFKARFGGEIIAHRFTDFSQRWKMKVVNDTQSTCNILHSVSENSRLSSRKFLHVVFTRVFRACITPVIRVQYSRFNLHGRKCIRVMLQFPWSVLQIIIYSDIPLEWISHSRNYKGNGLKLSAQRFLESLGWTWALLMIGR